MGRPAAVIPSARIEIRIPVDVKSELDIYLFSEVEGRIPYGAYSQFFENLTREFFTKLKEAK